MKWNTSGNYRDYVPKGFKELPLELQRSHSYPKDPGAILDSVQDYLDSKPKPVYLPQQLAFRRNQTPPWKQAWLSGTIALLRARQLEAERFNTLREAGLYNVPVKPIAEQAAELEEMPLPLDQVNPSISHPGDPEHTRMSGDDVTRYGDEYKARIQQLGEIDAGKHVQALNEVRMQGNQLNSLTTIPQVRYR